MTEQPPVNEELLMRLIARHDHSALAELYDHYSRYVYGMAFHILQNKVLAEEATQDTFMKVWKQSTRWNPERGALKTWLLTIARFTAIDRLRLEKRESPWTAIGLDDMLNLIGQPNVVDESIPFDIQQIKQMLGQLSEEQREAINLSFFHGMSHNEISQTLKTPLGTIKSRIRDGLKIMRGLLLHDTE